MKDHKSTSGFWWLVLGALLMAGMVGLQVQLSDRRKPAPVTLADGTILKVEFVEYGRVSQFRTAPHWWMSFKESLKPEWRKRLPGARAKTVTTNANERLTVWFSRFDPRVNRFVEARFDSASTGIMDPDGFRYRATGNLGKPLGADWVWSQSFANFPRRQQDLRLVGRVGTNPFEFTLWNPARTNPAPWKAESMPVWQTNGAVVVRLNEVQMRYIRYGLDNGEWKVSPNYDVFYEGKRYSDEIGAILNYSDPTGNQSGPIRALPFNWAEPVLRLGLQVHYSEAMPLATNRAVRLQIPRLPSNGEFLTFTNLTQFGKSRLDRVVLTGAGHSAIADGSAHSLGLRTGEQRENIGTGVSVAHQNVQLIGTGLKSPSNLLVFFRDAQGRLVKPTFPLGRDAQDDKTQSFEFNMQGLAEPVELFVALHDPLEFSFTFATPKPSSEEIRFSQPLRWIAPPRTN
jgi:hypothetical protein